MLKFLNKILFKWGYAIHITKDNFIIKDITKIPVLLRGTWHINNDLFVYTALDKNKILEEHKTKAVLQVLNKVSEHITVEVEEDFTTKNVLINAKIYVLPKN